MPELVRSIIGRFCEIIGSHNHARRHELRLPLTISLSDTRFMSASLNCPPTLSGYTRNISDTGLSLVLPSVHLGNRYLMDGDLNLSVRIELPQGAVNFQVAAVRFEMLDEDQVEWGYLVGMRIVKIAEQERQRLTQYLRHVNESKALTPRTNLASNAHSL